MTKKIEFDCSNIISYKKYINTINSLNTWYSKEYQDIKNQYLNLLKNKNYNKTFSIIKKHQELIIKLISRIVSMFDLKNKKIAIYISNSFARCTNLLDSDIDINFMYEDNKLSVYEELISSILYNVLKKYRDFVHDSISHRLANLNENPDKVIYVLHFKNKIIEEEITTGNEKLMYNLFNTKKDINSFIKYYTECLNSSCINEWIYYQKEVYSTPNYLNTLFSYIKQHEKETSYFKLPLYTKQLIDDIKKESLIIQNISFNDIQTVKHYLKNHTFKYISETLTLLAKEKNLSDFIEIGDKLTLINNKKIENNIKSYYAYIMILNLLCDEYNIPFRTRFSTKITKSFKNYIIKEFGSNIIDDIKNKALDIYSDLISTIEKIDNQNVLDKFIFNPEFEHINIKNYSPLSHINNVSTCYQHDAYLLPYIKYNKEEIPIHPDTLDDLQISREDVLYYKLVYPTSSTRTVYVFKENICLKLPVQRQITRSIRDVKDKELMRSEIAFQEISKYTYPNFNILKEEIHKMKEEKYNYIIRSMPDKRIYPWFYLIVSNKFDKEFMLKIIKNMVNIWMYYAKKGIYFESAHTQNFLVDEQGNIYYRDLSDIRILRHEIMCPSYLGELNDEKELHSIFFDRSMLSQNIEHFIKYRTDITNDDIKLIKNIINESIHKYQVDFPNYSMNYDKNRDGHHPVKVEKNILR